jgi:prophage maintenance system killer protein
VVELHRAVSTEFGGTHAQPGVVTSQFGLSNALQRPQATVFGKDAYGTFAEKAAALFFAILQNTPFQSGNRRVALAALMAFCELNERQIDSKVFDEKTAESMTKRIATHRQHGVPTELVFREVRELLGRAISGGPR